MKISIPRLAAILAAATGLASAAHATDAPDASGIKLSGEASLANYGMVKGTNDTDGDPQALIGFKAAHGPWFAGARIKNVLNSEGGDNQQEFFAGGEGKAGGFDLSLQMIYKVVGGTKAGTDNAYLEWQGSVAKTFGKTTLKLTEVYSDDSYGKTKAAWWSEASVSQKVTPQVAVSAALGRRTTTPAKDYTGWNLGGTYSFKSKTSLDLRWFDTDQHGFGDKYRGRIVVKVSQKF